MQYTLAALGGTFDHFHKGHRTLVQHALNVADRIVIGVTDEHLTRHKQHAEVIESYEDRVEVLAKYFKDLKVEGRVTVVKLTDIYGPTLTDSVIDVLVVSPLTASGARTINKGRKEKEMRELPIEVCVLEVADDGDHISSTRIRNGEIDREGFVYAALLNQEIKINSKQRLMLKEPMGTLYHNGDRVEMLLKFDLKKMVVAIGDETSLFCYKHNLNVSFYIFDNQIQRHAIEESIQTFLPASEMVRIENPSGVITVALVKQLNDSIKNKKHINIRGEEDLAVTPAILLLPLGSVILYGQPNEGLVMVVVDEDKKKWVREMLGL